MPVPTLNLIGGYKIPIIGYGTAGKREGDELEKALEVALESGYRHIDTAYVYQNEEEVGSVLHKWLSSGKIKREELFVVTKLPQAANTAEKVEEHLKESLRRLKLNYVDLYLIHFPVYMIPKDPSVRFGEFIPQPTDHVSLWRKLEEQVDAGRTKTIGLSNFNQKQIENILKIARIKPASLQVEIHIYLQSEELVKFAQDNGIVVVAYSPLGAPGRSAFSKESGIPAQLENPTVTRIAAKHKKTPAQVMLKFLLQRNIVVIPKSYSANRVKENINLFDFTLDDDDLKALRGLDLGEKSRIGGGSANFDKVRSHPEWPYKQEGEYLSVHI